MTKVDLFAQHRGRLFGMAYRMLGSVSDAEDVVQETFLSWHEANTTQVKSPDAYLSTLVTRRSIDRLRRLKVQREHYEGPWLPEPIVSTLGQPHEASVLADSLSIAFLIVLERLNPLERAVFLLYEVFDLNYVEISEIIEKSVINTRQIARRARESIAHDRTRFTATNTQHQEMTRRFLQSIANSDVSDLVALLADDVTVWNDSGGKARAARFPIHGANHVARYCLGLAKKQSSALDSLPVSVNGQLGVLSSHSGFAHAILVLGVDNGLITGVHVMMNPERFSGIVPELLSSR